MAIPTNPKPKIYRNLYENTGPGSQAAEHQIFVIAVGLNNFAQQKVATISLLHVL